MKNKQTNKNHYAMSASGNMEPRFTFKVLKVNIKSENNSHNKIRRHLHYSRIAMKKYKNKNNYTVSVK